ncbi:hypothetical protein BOSE21B_111169 [Bosea sp. 21B]|nr:hypothetical protein BOSE21B_111169 [Bosea sp. 21B]
MVGGSLGHLAIALRHQLPAGAIPGGTALLRSKGKELEDRIIGPKDTKKARSGCEPFCLKRMTLVA